MIFQLVDSRYAVASHAAAGETAQDAIAVFDKAVAAHGVPPRLLSDNGLALNPSRRGVVGQLVAHVVAPGTAAITGKPYKPTTQGKNERFHQTLFRYLDKQPPAAWEATPKADPPRPTLDRPIHKPPAPTLQRRPKPPADLPADTRGRTVSTAGTVNVAVRL